jgi:hypothetical protein
MVNGRVTAEQMEWLLARAYELDGNLSAALRQTITDARLLEAAREDYQTFRAKHPEVEIPYTDEGASYVWEAFLGMRFTEAEDEELRREERGDGAD